MRAWLTVIGSSLVYFASFGIINSFGFFQKYYQTSYLPSVPASTISFIGTIQITLMNLLAAPAGSLFDCYGLKVWIFFGLLWRRRRRTSSSSPTTAVSLHILRDRLRKRPRRPLLHSTRHPMAAVPHPRCPPRHRHCIRRATIPSRSRSALRPAPCAGNGHHRRSGQCGRRLLPRHLRSTRAFGWLRLVVARRSHGRSLLLRGCARDLAYELPGHEADVCRCAVGLQRFPGPEVFRASGWSVHRHVGPVCPVLLHQSVVSPYAPPFPLTISSGTYCSVANPSSEAKDYLLPLMNAASFVGRILYVPLPPQKPRGSRLDHTFL